ncbi:Tetratricopeptide repeat [Dermatophilus congolensis]|uniref:Tetratricopeptide repeat n=1 Tax=Dermatophilus congolensis TaxID=1863 RepID=A0A239VG99_9MICO|nr:hypothetical protein [Dermatophilus congolensis]SNV21351.1 Tetratricopeptide repeat [Dermatophilus congolensis]
MAETSGSSRWKKPRHNNRGHNKQNSASDNERRSYRNRYDDRPRRSYSNENDTRYQSDKEQSSRRYEKQSDRNSQTRHSYREDYRSDRSRGNENRSDYSPREKAHRDNRDNSVNRQEHGEYRSYTSRDRGNAARGKYRSSENNTTRNRDENPRSYRRTDGQSESRWSSRRNERQNGFKPREENRENFRHNGKPERGPRQDRRDNRAFDNERRNRPYDRPQKVAPEPRIDDDVTGKEIAPAVRRELRTLSKDNAAGVAQHLVMIERLLETNPEQARAHAEHIVGRAGRVPSVREARGLVAYQEGDWKTALKEFRTAQRLSGSNHLLPYIVDCERGTGRLERALDIARSPEAQKLDQAEKIELAIIVAGIRRDLGDLKAALVHLRGPELDPTKRHPWSGRLFYAYADSLQALGRSDEAREWFAAAIDADAQLGTDAAERVDDLDGTIFIDAADETIDDETDETTTQEPTPSHTESATENTNSDTAPLKENDTPTKNTPHPEN